jgi:hypothetical protein
VGIHEEVVAAGRTDVKILLEFQVMDHAATIRALVPEAFRHVIAAVARVQVGFAENAHENGGLCGRLRSCRGMACGPVPEAISAAFPQRFGLALPPAI